jgi:group I intron endonuclease
MKESKMFVYLITNTINGKQYVGQHSGKDLQKYWRRNIVWALHNQGQKLCLYAAIRKYGPDAFEIKPLVIVGTKNDMDYYERGMIKALNTKSPNGYNLTDGGEGTPGHAVSEEGRKKMSLKSKGRPSKLKGTIKSKESNRKNSEAHKGKALSDEHKRNIGLGQLGSSRSEETKRKMRMSAIENWKKRKSSGYVVSEDTKNKMSEAHKQYWKNRN